MSETRYTGRGTNFYVADGEVAKVVELAIALRRPLLVEGEPGCGKTKLAYSIATELNLGEVIRITVKSTSRAQDLLYRVNALKRLQDAQIPGHPKAQYIYPYITLGPLGDAFNRRRRCVVLIDEVDKADIDFPNDLLDVLESFSFAVDDLPAEEEKACAKDNGFGRVVAGDPSAPPIVVITSNREKRLPEPFLRRCLYVRVTFPTTEAELEDIVRKNIRIALPAVNESILKAAIVSFLNIRALSTAHTQKPPSTSELIDWVRILHWDGVSPETLSRSALRPPNWRLLFKTAADLDAYDAASKKRATE